MEVVAAADAVGVQNFPAEEQAGDAKTLKAVFPKFFLRYAAAGDLGILKTAGAGDI